MPVFINADKRMYALISYKVLYSKFSGAPGWQEMGLYPTPRMYAKSLLKDRSCNTFFVVRSPYERTASCFMDKFRKQPLRITEPKFHWQYCHKLIYPYCGLTDSDTDLTIAERFLQFSFNDFLDLLPSVYMHDVHYQPQIWSLKLHIGGKRTFSWPGCTILKVEDSESLHQIPDIDFSVRSNYTTHLTRDFEITRGNKAVIQKLYEKDFLIGDYSK
jgi:hypothetical protein